MSTQAGKGDKNCLRGKEIKRYRESKLWQNIEDKKESKKVIGNKEK